MAHFSNFATAAIRNPMSRLPLLEQRKVIHMHSTPSSRGMRRSNREVREPDQIRDIIERCYTVRLGLHDAQGPFVVPMSFGYDWALGPDGAPQLTLWLHCAGEGRKLDALAADPLAAFEMDAEGGVIEGDFSCAYSFAYESVMGTGLVRHATNADEKLHGLTQLMEHMAPGLPVRFSDTAVERVTVLALDAAELSAKRREG